MDRRVKGVPAVVELQAGRRIQVIASTAREDREGDIIEVTGWDLTAFRRNPVVLFNHDPSKPIGRCVDIGVMNGRLEATVEFPPAGTSPLADEVHGLIRHGAVSALSVGFLPRETKPIPGGRGLRIAKAELLELSLVSVPANPDCVVLQRNVHELTESHLREKTLSRREAMRELQKLRRTGEIMELRHAPFLNPKGKFERQEELEKMKEGAMQRKQIRSRVCN